MNELPRNDVLKILKQQFLSGNLKEYDHKYDKTVAAWEKSRAAGAEAHTVRLSDDCRDLHVFDRIDDISKCHLAYFRDYYESRSTALERMGGAMFYLDTKLTAFHKSGSASLLNELKSRGLRIGTQFSVENVGVFAGNTAPEKPFVTCFSAGEGHYCDILTPYACIARYGETSAGPGFHAVTVIFLPLDKCFKNSVNSATFMLEAGDFTYKNRILYPHIERRFHLLEQSVQCSTDITLLVDDTGVVVFANSRFENEFGMHITSVIGSSLRDSFPELSFVLKSLRSGKEISAGNTALGGAGKRYYVECLAIKENNKVIGLKVSIKTAEQIRKYSARAERNNAVYNFQDIIAVGAAMKRVKNEAKAAASSPANVLITGESGTGKELFAQAIHNASSRFAGPFVPISCGGFSRETVETVLIGTEKNPGKFIQADGGTLFLDGISEMSQDMQSFLLRFLEDGVVTPIGSRRSVHADVRVIAAAGSEVLQKVKDGSFRLDLYYRLNVLRIDLPPLRERQADMQELSNYFVTLLSAGYGKNIFSVSAETVERFKRSSWPGNLRQLKNTIERSVLKAEDGHELEVADVEEDFTPLQTDRPALSAGAPFDVRDAEAERIIDALIKHNGNKAKTARYLGMSRGTLYSRLRELEEEGVMI